MNPLKKFTMPGGAHAPGVMASASPAHPISDLDLRMRALAGEFRVRASLANGLGKATLRDEKKEVRKMESDTWEDAANLLIAALDQREGKIA